MQEILERLISVLPGMPEQHRPTQELHGLLNQVSLAEAKRIFSGASHSAQFTGPFKGLSFPYHEMGNINSLHLFGIDELIIFSFYYRNRNLYKRAVDLGANIGLHSIMMNNCGYEVTAYEPDPKTFEILKRNLDLNHCSKVNAVNAAVSVKDGTMDFIRVLGNMTGSHLAGNKQGVYGETEKFSVPVHRFKDLLAKADLLKIDVEGHEKDILLSTDESDWKTADALVEIGTPENATAVFNHFHKTKVNFFAQKIGWQKVTELSHMPTSYKEGTLFISSKERVPGFDFK